MSLKRTVKKFLLLLAILFSGIQFATASCWLDTSAGYVTSMVDIKLPLDGTISMTESLPVGSLLYLGKATSGGMKVGVECDSAGQFYEKASLMPSPVEDSSSWTPPRGKLYKTSVSGVGIWFWSTIEHGAPMQPVDGCDGKRCSSDHLLMNYALVKTGVITPGVINSSLLPVYTRIMGQNGNFITVFKFTFSGNLVVTVPTCTTPDVQVEMGSWPVNKFTRINAVTNWKDASIKMTNCQRFYGYYKLRQFTEQGSIVEDRTVNSNFWSLRLSPQNGVIDSSSGVMAIDNTFQNAANGIGIQLSYGSINSAGSDLVNFTARKEGILPSNGQETIIIPLSARYIQTEDYVKPGKANGKLVFTISYK
ncbi:fimbrial protein [Klebsiella aerogenes]|uniref:fimbrial protein n=1 Tax=Klebsiella aerogenes TaxID=548 RepID=UPI0032DA8341